MTTIDVISGFLGAGKTTFIKKLIAEGCHGEKLVLIENEFGEASIDSGFLREQGLTISEINSGCICCSLVGDFTAAIQTAVADWKPDRILIEPSGVGKLSEILATVHGLCKENPSLVRGSAITVVDAGKCSSYLSAFAEFYEDQIRRAELLLLSRTQQLCETAVTEAVQLVRELNGTAAIVTTPWEQLSAQQVLSCAAAPTLADELYDELLPEQHAPHADCAHTHHHHADDIFASWSIETPKSFTEQSVNAVLTELNTGKYGAILRAKGILPADGRWIHFDYVPGEQNVRRGPADVIGKICVIGVGLNRNALSRLFGI